MHFRTVQILLKWVHHLHITNAQVTKYQTVSVRKYFFPPKTTIEANPDTEDNGTVLFFCICVEINIMFLDLVDHFRKVGVFFFIFHYIFILKKVWSFSCQEAPPPEC